MKLSKEQLDEIVIGFENNSLELEFCLNINTGETILLSDDVLDEELVELIQEGESEEYISLPELNSNEGYNDMMDFTETVTSARLRNELLNALSGRKGVFKRFKDVLSQDNNELDRYYKFVDQQNRTRIIEWLKLHTDFEIDE